MVSLAAIFCQTYVFAPPAFSFYIADPHNAVAIAVFEMAALLVSRVSSREKSYAIDEDRKRRIVEGLYSISRGALLLDVGEPPEQKMAELIQKEFDAKAVVIIRLPSGSIGVVGMPHEEAVEQIHQLIAKEDVDEVSGPELHRVLSNGNRQLGRLLVVGDIPLLVMDSLASLVCLTLERHQAFVNEGIAKAARQTEQLRTTVLDGLAHAFRTPLTVIHAASTGLLEIGSVDELQGQLIQMIDVQAVRLNEMTTRLLRTARVDGENISLEVEWVSIPTLIQEVIDDFRGDWSELGADIAGCPTIDVAVLPYAMQLAADHEMLAGTLKELLNNAAKYSSVGSPIDITASENDSELVISVRSRGVTIKLEDRELIFERFYRGSDHGPSVPGTGIGLSVARRVTEAHGGQIWVVSDEIDGTTFYMSLPKAIGSVFKAS